MAITAERIALHIVISTDMYGIYFISHARIYLWSETGKGMRSGFRRVFPAPALELALNICSVIARMSTRDMPTRVLHAGGVQLTPTVDRRWLIQCRITTE